MKRIKAPEETIDRDGRLIRPGDMLTHPTFGLVQLNSVDLTSYSIPMVIVRLIKDGEYTVEIVRSAVEFTKKG